MIRYSVQILGFLCLAFVTAGCQPKPSLYLYNWTYYIPDEVLWGFEKESGVKVTLDTYDSNETMYAKLLSGSAGFDLAVPSGDYVSIMIGQDMLQPLQKELLPNFAEYNPATLEIAHAFDPGNRYAAPYFMGAAGVTVNTDYVKSYEESWNVFNRTDLKGRMTMMNDMREVMGDALAYLGYSVNSVNPQELEAAKKVVLNWKENLLKFDAETFGKDFAAKNTYAAQGYAETILTEVEEADNLNYRFFLPKEGGPMYMDSLVLLKNSKNVPQAHAFINYVLQPETHAKIADTFYYPTLLKAADAFRKIVPAYTIEELAEKNYELKKDLGAGNSLYLKVWEEVMQY